MQPDLRLVKERFERNLAKYDECAVVQKDTARKLAVETAKICKNFGKVFELGCGTGLLTKELIKHINYEKYILNDITERAKYYIMFILSDFMFINGNAAETQYPKNTDLIISNAMFQWISDLNAVKGLILNSLNKNGILAFSTFGRENFREIKDVLGLSLDYLTKDEIIKILGSDFKILYSEEYTSVLEFETPYEILAHIKNTGVNSLTPKSWTIKDFRNFDKIYRSKYKDVKLTYNPVIIIAEKI